MSSTESSVRATLKGVTTKVGDGKVIQYRGIRYATVEKRFAKPKLNTKWSETTDYTKFGPRCPQTPTNIGLLMQIPKHIPNWDVEIEDEFLCTNLTVTCPTETSATKLPVLIWIYGGSQMNSYGYPAQQLGDTGPMVARSIEMGKPIIIVAIHYRLNIFGFGGNEGELNLDLQDQRMAIEWVKRYIDVFGGDPNEITVAGESAGAIYTHALLTSGTEVQRAVLSSGSLLANPPQPDKRGLGLLGVIEGNLQLIEFDKGNMNPATSSASNVEGASAESLVQSLLDLQVTSKWVWQEPNLKDYDNIEKVFGKLKGLMVGDCQVEGIIYRPISNLDARGVLKAFETGSPKYGKAVADAYGVDPSNDLASQTAAYEFIGDAKFNFPASLIPRRLNESGGKAYRYVFDEPNPFARDPEWKIAHHAADLFAQFGGYDEHVGDEMRAVGKVMREKWVLFVNGEEPWSTDKVFAYGPEGKTGEITLEEVASRRRQKQFKLLEEIGLEEYQKMWLAIQAAAVASTSKLVMPAT